MALEEQHFQDSVKVSDIEQERGGALWRGDARNKLHLFPGFAHLQFQTGLQSKMLFRQQPTPGLWAGPRVPLCLLSRLSVSRLVRTPGTDPFWLSSRLPSLLPPSLGLVGLSRKPNLEPLQLLPFYSSSFHLTVTFSGFEALSPQP